MPLISRALPYSVKIGSKKYKLATKDKNGYKVVHTRELCRVVKAEDRRKGSTDVVVSAPIVLEGLVQSVFANQTIVRLHEAQADCAMMTEAWVNAGTANEPIWKAVKRDVATDVWSFVG